MEGGPDQYGSVGWASSGKVKGLGFNSWSGHMRGLSVLSLVGVRAGDNPSMILSHINVSLPLFLPLFPCLKINKENLFKIKKKERK